MEAVIDRRLSRYRRSAMNTFISGDAGLMGSHLLGLLHKDENVSRMMIFDNLALT